MQGSNRIRSLIVLLALVALIIPAVVVSLHGRYATAVVRRITVDVRDKSSVKVGDALVQLKLAKAIGSDAVEVSIAAVEPLTPGYLPVGFDDTKVHDDRSTELRVYGVAAPSYKLVRNGLKTNSQRKDVLLTNSHHAQDISVTQNMVVRRSVRVKLRNITPEDLPITRSYDGLTVTIRNADPEAAAHENDLDWIVPDQHPNQMPSCCAIQVESQPGLSYQFKDQYDVHVFDPACTILYNNSVIHPDGVVKYNCEPMRDKYIYLFQSLEKLPNRFTFEISVPLTPRPADHFQVVFKNVHISP